ncbi:MAG: serine hydrolase [Candidatus Izemoplasmatales bacterium]|nr:serine hydrolase [Candidatus Izemoplasmatales bacterium]
MDSKTKHITPLFSNLFDKAKETSFSGHMVFMKGNQTLFEACLGVKNHDKGLKIYTNTYFFIASGTKFLTALAIGRLIDEGKLTLRTYAKDILDLHLGYDEHITIEQLLSHTSGMPDYLDENEPDCGANIVNNRLLKTNDYLSYFEAKPMVFQPGASFRYNNGAYVYLALIIEALTKMSYHDYVNEVLLKPLDIGKCGIYRTDLDDQDVAIGYLDEVKTPFNHAIPIMGGGDGGARMNAAGLLKIFEAFYSGKIISPSLKDAFTKPYACVNRKRGIYYGLGLWLYKKKNTYTAYLEGGDAGISFKAVYDENSRFFAYIVSNTTEGVWSIVDPFDEIVYKHQIFE